MGSTPARRRDQNVGINASRGKKEAMCAHNSMGKRGVVVISSLHR